jgi:two-component system, cell cycle sensor histidine kinase and response regulator CckA
MKPVRLSGPRGFFAAARISEPPEAEGSLLAVEQRYARMVANLPGFVYRCANDRHWTMDFISDGCRAITGRGPEDFVGNRTLSYAEIVHPEHRERLWRDWQEVLSRRGIFEGEYPVIHADGETRWVWERGRGVFSESGRLLYLEGFIADTTERRQAAERLRESEQKFRLLAENTLDVIWQLDPDLRITYVNPASERLFGYPPQELIGTRLSDHCDPKEMARMAAIVADRVERPETDTGVVFETFFRHRDGQRVATEIHGSVLADARGRPVALQGTARDITERKRAEEALRESEDRLNRIIHSIDDVLYGVDGETGEFVFLSPSFERVLGYTLDDIARMGGRREFLRRVIQDDRFRDQDRLFGELRSDGRTEPPVWEAWWRRKNGDLVCIEDRSTPLFEQGRLVGTQGVLRNVTERKRAEEAQERLRSQLIQAQRMESVGQLAGGVAHDFNNMLSVIMGNAEMALERAAPGDPFYSELREIHHAAQRSAEITRQLLAFARKQTILPSVLDLNETVEGMLKMLRRLIGEDIDLVWMPGNNLWPVKLDPSQMDQVLANLCVNARDAVAGVGRVVIETGTVVFDEADYPNEPGFVSGEYVWLAVGDDGCGMDEETLDRIFEPFFTTKEVGEGTGLGLPTVYGIVKQHEGFIDVRSEPGKGTTFKIHLPRHEGEIEAAGADGSGEVPRGRGETVLLVEDEPAIMRLGEMMLERLGYRVLAASTPGEALRLAEERPGGIDLLVTDVVMPDMNGRELADRLRHLDSKIETVFISGYTADVIARRGVLEEGANFIQKPFQLKDLAHKVRTVLDRR